MLHCDCGGAIVGCSVGVDVVGSWGGLAGFVFMIIGGGWYGECICGGIAGVRGLSGKCVAVPLL